MRKLTRKILRSYPADKGELIGILQKVQEKIGYLPEESISEIANYLDISENEVYGVASFYAQFRFDRPGKHIIKVCLGTACHVLGGEDLLETVERELKINPGGTTKDGRFSLIRVACLGCCALAPVIMVDDNVYGRMSTTKVKRILGEYDRGSE